MEIKLKRVARKKEYTIGKIYLDGEYECDSIEDRDRYYFGQTKVKSETAIPCGRYRVTLNVVSPRFGGRDFYKKYANGGRLPRLLNVPNFEGVLMHVGNTEKDSAGCIIVGKNKVVGKVVNSKETFINLYKKLQKANERKEEIWITIE